MLGVGGRGEEFGVWNLLVPPIIDRGCHTG